MIFFRSDIWLSFAKIFVDRCEFRVVCLIWMMVLFIDIFHVEQARIYMVVRKLVVILVIFFFALMTKFLRKLAVLPCFTSHLLIHEFDLLAHLWLCSIISLITMIVVSLVSQAIYIQISITKIKFSQVLCYSIWIPQTHWILCKLKLLDQRFVFFSSSQSYDPAGPLRCPLFRWSVTFWHYNGWVFINGDTKFEFKISLSTIEHYNIIICSKGTLLSGFTIKL